VESSSGYPSSSMVSSEAKSVMSVVSVTVESESVSMSVESVTVES